ncbi:3beta-hydroxysteroid-4alpha-carboxylate 3-dehydrogenase [Sarracenia purpurea var. burkii]
MLMLVPDTWDSIMYYVATWNQLLKDIHTGDESLPYASKFDNMLGDLKVQAEALVLFANDDDGLLTCAIRPSNATSGSDQPKVRGSSISGGTFDDIDPLNGYSGNLARQLISNAKLLVNWIQGKNLIFSSAAPSVTKLRRPNNVANFSSMERAKVSQTLKAIDFASVMDSLSSHGLQGRDTNSAAKAAAKPLDMGKTLSAAGETDLSIAAIGQSQQPESHYDLPKADQTSYVQHDIPAFYPQEGRFCEILFTN